MGNERTATLPGRSRRPWARFAVAAVILATVLSFALPAGPLTNAAGASAPSGPASPIAATHAGSSPSSPLIREPTRAESPSTTLPSGLPTPRMAAFTLPGPHPAAWGSAGVPPGGEALAGLLGTSPSPTAAGPRPASGGNPANGSAPWQNRFCSGLWPWASNDSASQSYYWDGCYGHDEPGIESYSPLAGSGGNVSWNVTLPIDRNATANQSDLYVAIWFGLTLNDPLAWMHQCFLELQFYPDQTFTNGPGLPNPAWTVNGAWIGAAVAWQIEAATGYEDPCFYQPLYNGSATSGPSYFNMTQGDQLTVTFSGWSTSAYGENLTIADHTSGTRSEVNLWDFAGNYPLNPSYSTNSYENGLQWTPGGEYPAVFAFENGHAGNPSFPSNNPYGGCSPGRPPATASYPSVPCPSYDPGSWANDTLVPWHIGVPTFFNAQSSDAHPAQVAFTQDFGGVGAIQSIGNGACSGLVGSAWCSYPWYSYSCAAQAFEFGATDYPGVSEDFGQYNEYSPVLAVNGLGFGYFPPTNFSVPACGQPSYNVTVATSGVPGGTAYFLSHADAAPTNVTGLLPGNYSLSATPPPGAGFQGWTTSGNVRLVGGLNNTWVTLEVLGNGSVTAWFTTSPVLTNVRFVDAGTSVPGRVVLSPARTFTGGVPLDVVANGSVLALPPGVYGVQALPTAGANFTGWSVEGRGASLAPSAFPYAWLDVAGDGTNVTVTATSTPSPSYDWAYLLPSGSGAIDLNGTSYTAPTLVGLPVGGYAMTAVPAPGYTFGGWSYGPSGVLTDFNASTYVGLENSSSASPTYLVAFFYATEVVNVTLDDAPVTGGTSSVATPFVGLPSGTTVFQVIGPTSLYAFASGGWNFTGWSVNNTSAAWVQSPSSSVSLLALNASVTITAQFARAAVGSVHFAISPASSGFVVFNGGPLILGATTNASVANGSYPILAVPNAGDTFVGFSVNGSAALTYSPTGFLLDFTAWLPPVGTAGDANVTAVFANSSGGPPPGLAVTFVATVPAGVTASIGSAVLTTGTTVFVPAGTYNVLLSVGSGLLAFNGWVSTPGLSFGSPTSMNTTVDVTTSGTITAVVAPFGVTLTTVAPNPTEVGVTTTFHGAANGTTGPYAYSWIGLPQGCASANSMTVVCAPTSAGSVSVRLSATDAYGEVGLSGAVSLTVTSGLRVTSLSASPSAFDLGGTTTIGTILSGGMGPFFYNFTALPTGCTSANVQNLSCTPTATGTFPLAVQVGDSFLVVANGTGTVTVNPTPAVASFVAAPSTTDVGVTTTLTVTVTGGTAPFHYAYTGLPSGCSTTDAAALPCTPLSAGLDTITVVVSDASGLGASQTLTLTVNPAPGVSSFTASRGATDVGLATVLTAVAAGGTGPLAYHYTGLPLGCPGANASSLVCTPTGAGSTTVTVTVTDAVGGAATTTLSLTMNPPPSIASAAFSPASVASGSPTTLTVSASGGTGALSYSFSGLPQGCLSSNTATLSCTPGATGTFSVRVTATDTLGVSANTTATLAVASSGGTGLLGLSGGLGYAVLAVVVLLVIGVVALLVWRSRSRRAPPNTPPAGAGGPASAPEPRGTSPSGGDGAPPPPP